MPVKKSKAEAQTPVEKAAWWEARGRSEELLEDAKTLHDYLHGAGGNPFVINDVFKHADAIRFAMNSALSIRLARFELKRLDVKKTTARKKRG